MQKIIREVDDKRGIVQITVADERWYVRPSKDEVTGLPIYKGVPSVTWIAGFYPKGIGFYKWLAQHGWDDAQAAKQAAGDKGSRVHLAVDKILNGEEFRIDTKVLDKASGQETELSYEELVCVKSFCDALAELKADYEVETLANEIVIFSDQNNYAGTVDWVVRLTPKSPKNAFDLTEATVFVVDFKTGQNVWKEYELQVSAYRHALESGENPIFEKNENGTDTSKPIDVSNFRTAILQLGYARNKAKWKWTETPDEFALFLTAQKIWKAETEGQDVTVRDFPIVLAPGKQAEAANDPVVVSEEEPIKSVRKTRKAA